MELVNGVGDTLLSVREVTGTPIMFASVGESMEDFEAFHPDRMASRILGMGDMMSLIEKAEATYTEEESAKAEETLLSGQFTLEDFLDQLQMLKRMGPLQGLLGMMPGMSKQLKDVDIDDRQFASVEAIIRSMTPKERKDPKGVLNGRRRKRIAAGSGTTVTEVNRLVKQFEQIQKVMKSASKMAGQQGGKPKGVKGAKAQAAAVRQMQSQLGAGGGPGGPGGGGGGLGGFSGLQPAEKG